LINSLKKHFRFFWKAKASISFLISNTKFKDEWMKSFLKLYSQIVVTGDRLPVEVVDNIYECLEKNYSWVNSKITFDHVGHAYLALFQV